jgi:hypothetical protein
VLQNSLGYHLSSSLNLMLDNRTTSSVPGHTRALPAIMTSFSETSSKSGSARSRCPCADGRHATQARDLGDQVLERIYKAK